MAGIKGARRNPLEAGRLVAEIWHDDRKARTDLDGRAGVSMGQGRKSGTGGRKR